jgi:hypothetical protein
MNNFFVSQTVPYGYQKRYSVIGQFLRQTYKYATIIVALNISYKKRVKTSDNAVII